MLRTRTFKQTKISKKPFWLPASSFYFLVAGFSAASFFLVLGIIHEETREPQIVVAGLVASGVLITGVVVRELLLRNARERFIAEQKQLDASLSTAFASIADAPPRKLTLERNAAAIRNIKSKSEAAMVFENIAQGHREVFELCAEYRKVVAREIRNIHPDSPRLKALIQGNEFALKTHKLHILRWAELESKSMAFAAGQSAEEPDRMEFMERAKRPLEIALSHYPEEPALRDSLEVITELLLSARLQELILDAENAAARDDQESAVVIYRQALDHIEMHVPLSLHGEIQSRIEREIAGLETRRKTVKKKK